MIPEPDEYLSFLMGAAAISDEELNTLGIRVIQGAGARGRGLLIPGRRLAAYKSLVREKLAPGFWNDIVGRDEILFIFKMADGSIEEFSYSDASRQRIAELCAALNNEPIEKTSDVPRYMAGNPFLREFMVAFHGAGAGG